MAIKILLISIGLSIYLFLKLYPLQLKKGSGRKANNEDHNNLVNKTAAEKTVNENDENLEYLDEVGDMESYIDEVSQQIASNVTVSDRATSSGNLEVTGGRIIEDSPLPEVCDCLEISYWQKTISLCSFIKDNDASLSFAGS